MTAFFSHYKDAPWRLTVGLQCRLNRHVSNPGCRRSSSMRLLDTETLQFRDAITEESVEYAILSHRWGDEEVSFQDMQNLETAKRLKGFDKIQNACNKARMDNHRYIWIDTCCINKDSSAELSEAINSMYRWYARPKYREALKQQTDMVSAGTVNQRSATHTFRIFNNARRTE